MFHTMESIEWSLHILMIYLLKLGHNVRCFAISYHLDGIIIRYMEIFALI